MYHYVIAQGAKNGGKVTITMSKEATKATLQTTTKSIKFAVNSDANNFIKVKKIAELRKTFRPAYSAKVS